MKTRLFAALVTLSAMSSLVGCGQDSITAPSSLDLPKGVALAAESFSNMTVEQQVRFARVLGYHEVPAPGTNPSLQWQVDFSAYVSYLANGNGTRQGVELGFLVEAEAMARDLSKEVPGVLSWTQKRSLAQKVGFGTIGANYDNPTPSDLTALKRWNKNLYLHIGASGMTIRTLVRHTEAIIDAI
jgi:hypothetical protein